jgi:cell division septal protein FtsQ
MIRRSSGRNQPVARPIRPAALRAGARPGGGMRRTKPVRRASAGLTPVRAGALLAILIAGAGIYGLAASNAFELRRTTVTGATWTPESEILAALALPQGANVFTVHAGDLEQALRAIPSLRGATVEVSLPDEVRIAVDERVPLLVWRTANGSFLVDADGNLFAEVGPDMTDATAALPVVADSRDNAGSLAVGSTLDDATLDAALRLGSLTPADVGSAARSLVLRLDDRDGFTMQTQPASWIAVFGFYTPTLRTTELIPGQVRLLRSLLAGRETNVERIVLADDHSGTYVPRSTETPAKSPRPARTPRPTSTSAPTATSRPRTSQAPAASPEPGGSPAP